jgi:signal transduction histidine kinase
MVLDTKTLLVVAAVVAAAVALALVLLRRAASHVPGIGKWACASAGIGIGLFLVAARPIVLLPVSVIAGNGLTLFSFALFADGIRDFVGVPGGRRFNFVVAALSAIGLGYFFLVDDSLTARTALISLGISVISARSALDILLRKFERSTAATVLGIILAFGGVFFFARTMWNFSSYVQAAPLSNDPVSSVTFLIVIVLIVGLGFGLLIMVTHRLNEERKDRERRAGEAHEHLLQAIETMTEAFALFDPADRLVLCNSRYKEFYPGIVDIIRPGTTFEELVRASVERGHYPEAVGREEAWIGKRLARHASPEGAHNQLTSEGRWLRITETRTKTGGFVGVRADVTELVKREQELRDAKEKTDLADRAKTQFLANMSHELRTPLNSIIGFGQMLGGEYLGPLGNRKYHEYAGDIVKSGTHLLNVVNDVLDVSKIEAGSRELAEETVAIHETVDACLMMVESRAADAGVDLSVDIADGLTAIKGDSTALMQILLNLLSNAVKFTPPGGTVSVRASVDGDGAMTLDVSDTGIGISADQISRVLEPFKQVENAMTRSHEGTGLGLSLAKSLTELHGGNLCLESAVGKGTTATVRLPPDRVLTPTASPPGP